MVPVLTSSHGSADSHPCHHLMPGSPSFTPHLRELSPEADGQTWGQTGEAPPDQPRDTGKKPPPLPETGPPITRRSESATRGFLKHNALAHVLPLKPRLQNILPKTQSGLVSVEKTHQEVVCSRRRRKDACLHLVKRFWGRSLRFPPL